MNTLSRFTLLFSLSTLTSSITHAHPASDPQLITHIEHILSRLEDTHATASEATTTDLTTLATHLNTFTQNITSSLDDAQKKAFEIKKTEISQRVHDILAQERFAKTWGMRASSIAVFCCAMVTATYALLATGAGIALGYHMLVDILSETVHHPLETLRSIWSHLRGTQTPVAPTHKLVPLYTLEQDGSYIQCGEIGEPISPVGIEPSALITMDALLLISGLVSGIVSLGCFRALPYLCAKTRAENARAALHIAHENLKHT